jgi:hypothetical protein
MLKINSDLSVKFDKDLTQKDIVNLLIGMYNGHLAANLASQLQLKSNEWKKELQELFNATINLRYDEEMKNVFVNMNNPFFNQLDIKIENISPLVHPLNAFKG